MKTTAVPYVVITPARDEEAHIERTIHAMAAQTILPAQWVIVNDGSRDATGRIIDEYAREHPWITPLHREDRGFRKAGGGVVEAFYAGYNAVRPAGWDFIVKLDADLSFAPDYFERAFRRFADDPQLGIGGGVICNRLDGRWVVEKNPAFHVRGATKIYKKQCWNAIGGLVRAPGWDTLDEVKANMLGWKTSAFPELALAHYRPTGDADGAWKNWVKNGRANYISGYHPLFMVVKCLKRALRKPYVVGAAGLLYGFMSGYVTGIAQVDDAALIAYLRDQQMRRLLLRESIWR